MEKTGHGKMPKMLASCRAPFPDELLYGYVRDLAVMNELRNMADFEKRYISATGSSRLHTLYPTGLAIMCHNIGNETFPNVRQAISMTGFYERTRWLGPGGIQCFSETIIYPECQGIQKARYRHTERLRLCPACWAEDASRFGRGYLHVTHNLPGVKVCLVHRLPLLALTKETKHGSLTPLSPELGRKCAISNMEEALKVAKVINSSSESRKALVPLIEKQCKCGALYVAHPRSLSTGAGCPICAEKLGSYQWVSERVRLIIGEDWMLKPGFSSPRKGKVISRSSKPIEICLWNILYGIPKRQRCNAK